ncbi:MAG: bifunctional hydroxymethylpyrimidine kinase/phosphomethylpyrimidine kinase [Crenarchaeota archaeon]|nr:bifunctional hydroxymethylpyrimidine kinase/phosphomethylpyrimidine kinase [Thermoproteota archaeon]MDA1124520.1 bifunctional hydroxymethylpyrimidine kinase/phosphomethylpyrimidine kinase [Thermoproteota archaeon]
MNVLSIGGSDPSSGAGIQSDIKTFENHGVYGFTVITAITSQNTKKISKILPISSNIIKSQLESILNDFEIDAIKIGMLYNTSIIKTVHSMIKKQKCPIIVDPIIESTTKTILLKKSAIKDYKKNIIPLATIITPNIQEAKILAGTSSVKKAAKEIQRLGAKNVIITGYNESKNVIEDFILESEKEYILKGKKIQIINHGSGCNYSASIASSLALKRSIHDAAQYAKEYVFQSIKNSKKLGKGISITHKEISDMQKELSNSIVDFQNIKNGSKMIPECQTNFVFSKIKPKKIDSVLGISGRLVKAGDKIIQAGELRYGGSQHVATSVVEVSKKFPEIRSAINIKYNPDMIVKAKKKRMKVISYDRKKESKNSKRKENSSISWGISSCLKSTKPDIIFHKGDMGKEPMIIIFGTNPEQVVKKILSIQ